MKFGYDILLWSSFILLCIFNAFNVWYILARYKRKVEVQIEMHVKYCYSKGVMTFCVLLQYTQLTKVSWFDDSWWILSRVYKLIHRHSYENTKSMWRIEYSKFIKVKRKSCNYLTKWLTKNDVFENDVEYIEDIIRDVVRTQI